VISWVATLLTLADHLAAHPTASHAAMDAEQHQQPLPKGVTHKMDLAKYAPHTTCMQRALLVLDCMQSAQTLQHKVAQEKLAAYAQAEVANCLGLCRRIGSDEEQQLLRTAKDDLNISSSSRGVCPLCPCLLTNADFSDTLAFDTPLQLLWCCTCADASSAFLMSPLQHNGI